MGPVAVRLKLSGQVSRYYLVFYISLLGRYLPGGDREKPLAQVFIEDANEYELEALIAHR